MKILHAAETIKGGVATVMQQHLERQSKGEDCNCIYLIPDSQVEDIKHPYPNKKNMRTFKHSGRGVLSSINFLYVFVKLLFLEKPNVVHLHSSFAGFWGRVVLLLAKCIGSNIKVIYCPHAFSFLMDTSEWKKVIYFKIEKILALATNTIICVSRFEYEAAIKGGLPKHKMIVVYNGVEDGSDLASYQGNEHEAIKILWVGRLDYQKGFDLFVDAINRLGNHDLDITVIGDYVYDEFKVGNLSGINMIGWVDREEVRSWYSKADVLVMASRWEGFAMTPLEAMSFGLPVISSDCTSCPEMIIDDETGFLFKTESVDSLVELLKGLNKSKLASMRPKTIAHFQANFTQNKMTDQTFELY